MEEEEKRKLRKEIMEDNVEEFKRILNSNKLLQNTFNKVRIQIQTSLEPEQPLLLFAVQEKSQIVVEYLLSQDFVDKNICNGEGDNIYHVVCGMNAFHIACQLNNVFIVKRVYEILESLQLDLTEIKNNAIKYAIRNEDIEVIKYILSIDGIQIDEEVLFDAVGYSKIDIVVYLLNFYLCQSIPSHLHNQFHIFHFLNNHPFNYINNSHNNNNDYEYYLKSVEDNYNKIMNIKLNGNRIWHFVCINENVDVVQLIYSLKGIQPDLLNEDGSSIFLLACNFNSNIKVIKYLHKLFPSFIHSQIDLDGIRTAAYLVLKNFMMKKSDQLKTLHYLYLNGIDIHFLSKRENGNEIIYQSLYSNTLKNNTKRGGTEDGVEDMIEYLKVISQDFDYLENEHDDEAYRKPSFWKQFHHHHHHHNNNKLADEESNRVNEWKNRYEEHVLRHLSKMIQEHMLQLK